ncbi:MAG: SRPBCC family protein [Streptosporangiaceae bacterium]
MRRSIHIEAPVEKVFGFFLDTFRDPSEFADLAPGNPRYDEVKATKDGVGSYASWHARVYGLPMHGFDVVTDVVPGRHISQRSSNPMAGTWDYGFEPEGSGTKLTMEHRAASFWSVPPMRGLLDLAVDRMNEPVMERVKATIEDRGKPAAPSRKH